VAKLAITTGHAMQIVYGLVCIIQTQFRNVLSLTYFDAGLLA
jgi:hypothetical protein